MEPISLDILAVLKDIDCGLVVNPEEGRRSCAGRFCPASMDMG